MPADIYFLNHSGFILKINDIVLVFDYYKDPLQHVEKMITDGRNKIYFFVSHFHGIISIHPSAGLRNMLMDTSCIGIVISI